jgi:hypothetical protein
VLFRPWRSESHVLSAHLIENEQRGEMSFWDKATGIVALKERLEGEQVRQLALRPLEDVLHALGLSTNTATLGLYLFATQRLRTLGEAVPGMAGLDVKSLQPKLNALKRYAQTRRSSTDDELYAAVFEPVFHGIADRHPHTGEFSVAATCEACEVAMAAHLGEPVEVLREALRPASAVGGQGVETKGAAGSGVGVSHHSDPAVGPSESPLAALPDRLLDRVRAFARASDLGACIESAGEAPAGFRMTQAEAATSTPSQRRAWCLLAGISGQADRGTLPTIALDSEFIDWLADPVDASAKAFWEVLDCLRMARRQPTADPGHGSLATPEDA